MGRAKDNLPAAHIALGLLGTAIAAFLMGGSASPALAQVEEGLAAAYPGDAGIELDPRVIFFEDFETGNVGDLGARWDQVANAGGMSLPIDAPAGSQGSRSVEITSQSGSTTGGHLYTRLPRGLETVFIRHYVKYRSGSSFDGHTGLWLGGYNPATPYPQGGAGEQPVGNDRFFLTFQPYGASRMDFYTYWMGMGGLPNGQYWGNSFLQDPSVQHTDDEWMSIEVMVQLNDPAGSSNGELKLWVNGVPTVHMGPGFPNGNEQFGVFTPDPSGPAWPGFQWRSTTDLKANFVWLSLYEPNSSAQARFDQVVVASEYIGPIGTGAPPPPGNAPPPPILLP